MVSERVYLKGRTNSVNLGRHVVLSSNREKSGMINWTRGSYSRPALQRGSLLVEMALALIVSSIILVYQFSDIQYNVVEHQARATAQYMRILQTGLNLYAAQNRRELIEQHAVLGVSKPLNPTSVELKSLGFLPADFGAVSPLGLNFVHSFELLNCPGENCKIDGLSYSSKAYVDSEGGVRTDILTKVVEELGVDGSQSAVGSRGDMAGYAQSYLIPASRFHTQEGMVGIRLGEFSSVSAALSQYYRLDGSRHLLGDMNVNQHDIQQVKRIDAETGQFNELRAKSAFIDQSANVRDLVVDQSVRLKTSINSGATCSDTELGRLKLNLDRSGLVLCQAGVWQPIGQALAQIRDGMTCNTTGSFAFNPLHQMFVCNGEFWQAWNHFANSGEPCSPAGKIAQSIYSQEALFCRNGVYVRLSQVISRVVQMGPHLLVSDNALVAKPQCEIGGVPGYQAHLIQTGVDLTQVPPYQSTYVSADDFGSHWSVVLKLKRSSRDGGEEVSGSEYGLQAVLTVECHY